MALYIPIILLIILVAAGIFAYRYFFDRTKVEAVLVADTQYVPVKKRPMADLSRFRQLFLYTGYFLSISFVIAMVEWPTFEEEEVITQKPKAVFNPEMFEAPPMDIKEPEPPKTKTTVIEETMEEVEPPEIPEIEDTTTQEMFIPPPPVEEEEEEIVPDNSVKMRTEIKPEFASGGESGLKNYIFSQINDPGQNGQLVIKYVVWKDGTVRDFKVLKNDFSEDFYQEVARALRKCKFSPGQNAGIAVNSYKMLRLTFVQ